MRILRWIYDPAYGGDAVRAKFSGDIRVVDFDIVIWDPRASFTAYCADRRLSNIGPPPDRPPTAQVGWSGCERSAMAYLRPAGAGGPLTFDDRPDSGTWTLLERLAPRRRRLTFRPHSAARRFPQIVARALNEGHEMALRGTDDGWAP